MSARSKLPRKRDTNRDMTRKLTAGFLLATGALLAPPLAAALLTDDGSIDPLLLRAVLWTYSILAWSLAACFLFRPQWIARYWKQVVLAGFATIVPLALVEVGLQLIIKPGMRAATPVQHLEFSYTPTHNADGFRGGALPQSKTAGKRRLVMLGDSFVYGAGVGDSDTIPAQLQAQIGAEWEILNLGVTGTGIEDYRATAERLKHLEPDVVIVGIYVDNDIRVPREDVGSRLTNLQLVRMATRAMESLGDCRFPWIRQYKVDREIETLACEGKINPFLLSRATVGDEEAYYATLTRLFEREPVIRKDLMAIKSVWPSAHFTLMLFPSSFQVSAAYLPQLRRLGFTFNGDHPVSHKLQDSIERWAAMEHVDTLDALPWLVEAESSTGQRHYYTLDDHLNALGNRVIAGNVVRWLLSGEPLAPPTTSALPIPRTSQRGDASSSEHASPRTTARTSASGTSTLFPSSR